MLQYLKVFWKIPQIFSKNSQIIALISSATLILCGFYFYNSCRDSQHKFNDLQSDIKTLQEALQNEKSQKKEPTKDIRKSMIAPKDELDLSTSSDKALLDLATLKKEKIVAENAVQNTFFQGLGSIFVLVTVYASLQNLRIAQRSLSVTEDKQISERFGDTIALLASDKIHIRLGGIYALAKIADYKKADSEKKYYYRQVMETLNAYVREFSPFSAESPSSTDDSPVKIDIQAILNILSHGDEKQDYQPDLSRTSLNKVEIGNSANLKGATFAGANLQKANFWGVNLQAADFSGANLSGATFQEAILGGADFSDANLTGVSFEKAKLQGAIFNEKTVLQGTEFTDAVLEEAYFYGINLNLLNLQSQQLAGIKQDNESTCFDYPF